MYAVKDKTWWLGSDTDSDENTLFTLLTTEDTCAVRVALYM